MRYLYITQTGMNFLFMILYIPPGNMFVTGGEDTVNSQFTVAGQPSQFTHGGFRECIIRLQTQPQLHVHVCSL